MFDETQVALLDGHLRCVAEVEQDVLVGYRVDVDAGQDGWCLAWIQDMDQPGQRLFDLLSTPTLLEGRDGPMARVELPGRVPADVRLSTHLTWHSDARETEIRSGRSRLSIPPPMSKRQQADWLQRWETR